MTTEPIEVPETEDNYELYVSSKLIRAMPMKLSTFKQTKGEFLNVEEEDVEGYHVLYPDGYASWSPKKTFDDCNRLVTDSEKTFLSVEP